MLAAHAASVRSAMTTKKDNVPLPEDLRVLLTVIRKSGFAAAADELGLSPAYVSKRIQILETTLGTRLLHRTSRRIALTEDGERVQRWALRILDDFQQLHDELSDAHDSPRGRLHLCSSFGFGRHHVAPAVSLLAERYPELEIRLDLFDRVVDIVNEGFDLEIRVGDDIPGQHIGRQLVSNRRVVCAAPGYLQRQGMPQTLNELEQHHCLVIKERDNAFGIWNLERNGVQESVRVSGPLSSNNGEIVLQWALDGRGVVLRSLWDVKPLLDQGRLVQLLPEYSQSANVWAVYPTRLAYSGKLRACVEFLQEHFKGLSV
ncbi:MULTISPECIES: LysR substrate-binding domain-containing protein [Pseudomonas]|jgi:LysR family transcriptional regulator, transcriptional activator for dmlA|uniref:LysR family transcriptional regulator n=2 Tax=Pseudomonas fluorescens group TaxID=136843 RepID=A0AB36D5G0_9PSED|nr:MULTISPECIES: LysR substrate-binding domain-containing protein [Pseudomonas]MBA4362501.1 LysR family transcriptional regulator [Pseudomonas sp.]MDI1328574.1 LysR substrate-binding domain-containing protein [Pseudomonas sp.]MDO8404023.1 LysR substrate-binding domain-containing protein [Pseudomonas sp.]MDO8710309.1 LysR substrate-binding domain-containing protein [Pseudomonas sp.]MDO9330773.1 LysR substrate-binding domain-containing protein [Pseudomonas sp.]